MERALATSSSATSSGHAHSASSSTCRPWPSDRRPSSWTSCSGSRADLADEPRTGPGADGLLDLRVSAVTGEGVDRVVGRLADLVRAARAELPEPSQFVVHRPVREGYRVLREGNGWVVEGREAVRAVALSDLTRRDALDEAQRRLKRLGVDRALARAGAQVGDPVRIGGLTFDYTEDEVFG
jgi:GTPase